MMVDGSLRRMRLRPLVLRRIAAWERESRQQRELAGRVVAIWDRWLGGDGSVGPWGVDSADGLHRLGPELARGVKAAPGERSDDRQRRPRLFQRQVVGAVRTARPAGRLRGLVERPAQLRGAVLGQWLPSLAGTHTHPPPRLQNGRHRRSDGVRDFHVRSVGIAVEFKLDHGASSQLRAALGCGVRGRAAQRRLSGQLATAGEAVKPTAVLNPCGRPLEPLTPGHPSNCHLAASACPARHGALISHSSSVSQRLGRAGTDAPRKPLPSHARAIRQRGLSALWLGHVGRSGVTSPR